MQVGFPRCLAVHSERLMMPSCSHELVTHFPSTETTLNPSEGSYHVLLESLGNFLKVLKFWGKGRQSGTLPIVHLCGSLILLFPQGPRPTFWPWGPGRLSYKDNPFFNISRFLKLHHFLSFNPFPAGIFDPLPHLFLGSLL